jgi:very-short-patch-repair endonuclease
VIPLLDAHAIRRPEVNMRVAGYEVDLLWRAERLVVELDGRAFHASPAAFRDDRRRDADLQAAGYRVLRFTWHQIDAETAWVVTRIRQLLA